MKPQPINPAMRFVNPETGTLTREGFSFFQALRAEITGDGSGSVSVGDLEIFAMPQVAVPHTNDELVIMPVLTQEQPELMLGTVTTLAELEARIDAIEARIFAP